jgi:hypothetical protein
VRVSDNGHYLLDDEGYPFFYLADTAWALFYKLTGEDVDYYLRTSTRLNEQNYAHVLADYNKTPVKPTLNAETRYENSHEVFSPRLIAAGAGPVGERMTPHQMRVGVNSIWT